ncbi:hypothetical protein PMAYCL1PPCAC_13291, partial [Pristionchus mayeri]
MGYEGGRVTVTGGLRCLLRVEDLAVDLAGVLAAVVLLLLCCFPVKTLLLCDLFQILQTAQRLFQLLLVEFHEGVRLSLAPLRLLVAHYSHFVELSPVLCTELRLLEVLARHVETGGNGREGEGRLSTALHLDHILRRSLCCARRGSSAERAFKGSGADGERGHRVLAVLLFDLSDAPLQRGGILRGYGSLETDRGLRAIRVGRREADTERGHFEC